MTTTYRWAPVEIVEREFFRIGTRKWRGRVTCIPKADADYQAVCPCGWRSPHGLHLPEAREAALDHRSSHGFTSAGDESSQNRHEGGVG